jgi:hypothetical protein
MNGQGELIFLPAGFWTGAGLSPSFGVVFGDVFGAGLTGAIALATGFSAALSAVGFVVDEVGFGFV